MRYIKYIILILITVALIAYYYKPVKSYATETNLKTLAVTLVIDTSGSMTSTDPLKLRKEAADILIDVLSPEDYLGIITFDSKVKVVQQIAKVMGEDNKTKLKDNLASYIVESGDTDYNLALLEAQQQLDSVTEENISKVVLFITDGEPDPDEHRGGEPGFMDGYMENLWETVENMGRKNQSIYAIGFSDGIRSDILTKICLDTGGYYQILKDAEALTNGMLEIINSIKIQESVGMLEGWNKSQDEVTMEPVIIHDFYISKEGFRMGETQGITSSLMIGGLPVTKAKNTVIQSYELLIDYSDHTTESISLYDDGQKAHNDLKAGDGIWSNYIVFHKEGNWRPSFLVRGIYHNETIEVYNKVESFKVIPPGVIYIEKATKNLGTELTGVEGKQLSIPLTAENNSEFEETLIITSTVNKESLTRKQVTLKPKEIKNINIPIELHNSLWEASREKKLEVELQFQAGHNLTTINAENLNYHLSVVTYSEYATGRIKDFLWENKITGILFLATILSFIIGGEIIYLTMRNKRKVVNGVLNYHIKKLDTVDDTNKLFSLTGINKESLVISFGVNNPVADYYIPGTRYNYDIIISADYKPLKFRFMEGWNALFQRGKPIMYNLSVTKPGIIEKDGEIFTSMYLMDDEKFESGGFVFWFSMPGNKWLKHKAMGRNVLEGKYEEGK